MTHRLPAPAFLMLRLVLTVVIIVLGAAPVHVAATPRVLAVAWNDTDTKTGLLSRMSTVSPWAFQGPAITIAEHSALRSAGGRVFAISNTNCEVNVGSCHSDCASCCVS